MRLSLFQALLCGGVLSALPSRAELPTYTLQLQARANLSGNPSGAFNLEPDNLLPGSYRVPLTQDRQLAFRLSYTPEGRRALWWGQDGVGQRIYLLPDLGEDVLAGDPDLNAAGDLAFSVSNGSRDNGIYLFNAQRPDQVRILKEPYGITDWSSLALNEAGQLGFRASFSSAGRAYVVLSPSGSNFTTEYLAREQKLDSSSPFTYLYSPGFNDQGQIAGVGDVGDPGAGFQELHIWSSGGGSRRIAVTQSLDASSPVFKMASVQPALSNTGKIAFLGTGKNSSDMNTTSLWLWDGAELKLLAQNGREEIKELETFPPDINDSGVVVFRAFDSAGLRAVWVSDGEVTRRVVTEHDLVPSDLGEARLDQEKPSVPVFGGSPTINARGDVTFVAGLAPPDDDQEEWGTAIFVARSSLPEPDGGTGDTDGGPGDVDGGPAPDGGPGDVDGGSGDIDGGPAPDAGSDIPDAGSEEDAGSGVPDGGAADGGGTPGTPGTGADAGQPPREEPGDVSPLPEPTPSGCGCQSSDAGALWPWMLVGLAWVLEGRRRGARRA